MKKRICISIAGILVLSLLTGCSAAGQMRKQREQTAREEQHRTEQQRTEQEEGEEEKEEEEIAPGFSYEFLYHLNGRYAVQREMIYFASNEAVYGYNQITGEFEAFPLTGADYEMPETYSGIADNGKLYLDGEYLYYFTDVYQTEKEGFESLLYRIEPSTGEVYQMEFPFKDYVSDLYILDHQMYVGVYDKGNNNIEYHTMELEESGDIGEEITGTGEDPGASIPAGYNVTSVGNMKGSFFYIYQNAYFPQILLSDEEGNYVLYDPDTEEITELLSSD